MTIISDGSFHKAVLLIAMGNKVDTLSQVPRQQHNKDKNVK